MENLQLNPEKGPSEIADDVLQLLSSYDDEVQNSTIDYVIKKIFTSRDQELQKLETKVMALRNVRHDLVTRLAYLNHNKG